MSSQQVKTSRSDKYLILAISGGIDSVTLLDTFAKNRVHELWDQLKIKDLSSPLIENHKLKIVLAYFNHGTTHGHQVETFVKKLAWRYGLSLEIGQTTRKLTSEADFRDARYTFLRRLKVKLKADRIVTAHHAGDQTETILFNLIRGTGLAGLVGMQLDTGELYRPLLYVPKIKILSYAKKYKLQWCDDPTNQDSKFIRNRLRNKILPELEKINPKVSEALLRVSNQAREANEFIQLFALEWLTNNEKGNSLALQKFTELSRALQCAVIRQIHVAVVGHTRALEEVHIAEVLELTSSGIGNKQKKFGELVFQIARKDNIRVLMWKK